MQPSEGYPEIFTQAEGNHTGTYELLIPHTTVAPRVAALAPEVMGSLMAKRCDRKGRPPIILGIAHGALQVMLDLGRHMDRIGLQDGIHPELDTIQFNGAGPASARRLTKPPNVNPEGRDVVLVDDITDSGNTLKVVQGMVEAREPASLTTVCLLFRPEAERILHAQPQIRQGEQHPSFTTTAKPTIVDHIGFVVRCGFVCGYGMDLEPHGQWRLSPDIYARRTEGVPHEFVAAGPLLPIEQRLRGRAPGSGRNSSFWRRLLRPKDN